MTHAGECPSEPAKQIPKFQSEALFAKVKAASEDKEREIGAAQPSAKKPGTRNLQIADAQCGRRWRKSWAGLLV
jgi:hypothetical protein